MRSQIKQYATSVYNAIFKVERHPENVIKVKLQPDGTWKRFKGAASKMYIPLPKRKKRLNDIDIKSIVKSLIGTVHIHRVRIAPVGFIVTHRSMTYLITISTSETVGYSQYSDSNIACIDTINSAMLNKSKNICKLDDLR